MVKEKEEYPKTWRNDIDKTMKETWKLFRRLHVEREVEENTSGERKTEPAAQIRE